MSLSPRRSARQWQELVDQQLASGLSAPHFCKENNLGYPSFSAWRKRLTQSTEDASVSPAFVELTTPQKQTTSNPGAWKVELDLGSGMCLRIAQL